MSDKLPPIEGEIRDLNNGHFQIWKDNGWIDLVGKDHTIRALKVKLQALETRIKEYEAIGSDGEWKDYGQLIKMYIDQKTELDELLNQSHKDKEDQGDKKDPK